MGRNALMSYEDTILWINDTERNNDDVETLSSYLSVALAADIFGVPAIKLAKDVKKASRPKKTSKEIFVAAPLNKKALMSYKDTILWIALNDNAGDDEDVETLSGYISVALAADIFGVPAIKLAKDVKKARK